MYNRFHLFLHTRENENAIYISSNRVLIITNESSLGHRVHHVVLGVTLTDLTRPSTLTDTRPPCFEWGKPALRLGASAGTVGFLAGAIWYTTRGRRCQAPALRRARHLERGGGTAPQAFRRGYTWAGWGSIFFPLAGHAFLTLRATSLSLKGDPANTGKGMIPARQGVRGSVWDPEPSKERVGDWGGPETVSALLCVAERRATRPDGEWGSSTRHHMLGHERPEAVSPARGNVLTDLQSSILLSINFSLSLSLSLSPPPPLWPSSPPSEQRGAHIF